MTTPKPPHWICRICGRGPAIDVTLRRHQGLILVMRTWSHPGPYCRECGLRTFSQLTTRSAWQGWWGLFSIFVNGWVMISNYAARTKLERLPAPR